MEVPQQHGWEWAGVCEGLPEQVFVKGAEHKSGSCCQVWGVEETGGLGTEVQMSDSAEWEPEHRCLGAWG